MTRLEATERLPAPAAGVEARHRLQRGGRALGAEPRGPRAGPLRVLGRALHGKRSPHPGHLSGQGPHQGDPRLPRHPDRGVHRRPARRRAARRDPAPARHREAGPRGLQQGHHPGVALPDPRRGGPRRRPGVAAVPPAGARRAVAARPRVHVRDPRQRRRRPRPARWSRSTSTRCRAVRRASTRTRPSGCGTGRSGRSPSSSAPPRSRAGSPGRSSRRCWPRIASCAAATGPASTSAATPAGCRTSSR